MKKFPVLQITDKNYPENHKKFRTTYKFIRLTSEPRISLSHKLQTIRLTSKIRILVSYKLPTTKFFRKSYKLTDLQGTDFYGTSFWNFVNKKDIASKELYRNITAKVEEKYVL